MLRPLHFFFFVAVLPFLLLHPIFFKTFEFINLSDKIAFVVDKAFISFCFY